jgi:uncharacterized membrane protein YgdD (TMEM256/DUF423 family)
VSWIVRRFFAGLGLLIVWAVVAGLAKIALPGLAAWLLGLVAVALVWRWWHRKRIEMALEDEAKARGEGERLRRDDIVRYRELLGEASVAEPDVHVGRLAISARPAQQHFRWHPPTEMQRVAVDELTAALGNATVVRTVDGGAAEVIGTKDHVGYRYRVDAAGTSTLLSTDDSRVPTLRWIHRVAGAGILLFVGSLVAAFIVHHDGRIAGWLVPFVLVGFVMAFFGVALASGGPKNFLPDGERWQEHGSGWSD